MLIEFWGTTWYKIVKNAVYNGAITTPSTTINPFIRRLKKKEIPDLVEVVQSLSAMNKKVLSSTIDCFVQFLQVCQQRTTHPQCVSCCSMQYGTLDIWGTWILCKLGRGLLGWNKQIKYYWDGLSLSKYLWSFTNRFTFSLKSVALKTSFEVVGLKEEGHTMWLAGVFFQKSCFGREIWYISIFQGKPVKNCHLKPGSNRQWN